MITPSPSTSSILLSQSCFLGQAIHPLHQEGLYKLHIPNLQLCASQSQPGKKHKNVIYHLGKCLEIFTEQMIMIPYSIAQYFEYLEEVV